MLPINKPTTKIKSPPKKLGIKFPRFLKKSNKIVFINSIIYIFTPLETLNELREFRVS